MSDNSKLIAEAKEYADDMWVGYELVNQLVDALEAAEAQIAALREALEKIAQQSPEPSNSYDPQHENYLRRVLIEIARAALATGGKDE